MILRGMSVVFGVMATGVAMLCNDLGSLINTGGKLFGACMGPMFGFTLVSILVPCVNLKVPMNTGGNAPPPNFGINENKRTIKFVLVVLDVILGPLLLAQHT